MAKSKVDACIFCGEVPCVCNVKSKTSPPKMARPPTPKTEEPQPKIKASHLDAMKSAAAAAPIRPAAPEVRHRMQMQVTLSDDDIIWNAAIRNLAPLLCESDRQKYAGIITSNPHPDEMKVMWKARRKDGE